MKRQEQRPEMPALRPLGAAMVSVIDSRGQALTGRNWRRLLPDRYQPAEPYVSPFAPTAVLADYPGQRPEAIGVQPGLPGTVASAASATASVAPAKPAPRRRIAGAARLTAPAENAKATAVRVQRNQRKRGLDAAYVAAVAATGDGTALGEGLAAPAPAQIEQAQQAQAAARQAREALDAAGLAKRPMAERLAACDATGALAQAGRQAAERMARRHAADRAYHALAQRRAWRAARRAGLLVRLQARRAWYLGQAHRHGALGARIGRALGRACESPTPALLLVRHVVLPGLADLVEGQRRHALGRARLCTVIIRQLAKGVSDAR
jgi:hypothetical protein